MTVADLDKYKAHAWLLSPPCQPYTRQGGWSIIWLMCCFLFKLCLTVVNNINARPPEGLKWCSGIFLPQHSWAYTWVVQCSTHASCRKCCWIWGMLQRVEFGHLSYQFLILIVYWPFCCRHLTLVTRWLKYWQQQVILLRSSF